MWRRCGNVESVSVPREVDVTLMCIIIKKYVRDPFVIHTKKIWNPLPCGSTGPSPTTPFIPLTSFLSPTVVAAVSSPTVVVAGSSPTALVASSTLAAGMEG